MRTDQKIRRAEVTYGSQRIPFELLFRDRRTLEISVHPDLSVRVVSPRLADLRAVKQRVRSRSRWILRQQDFFRTFLPRPSPKQYVGGETHSYLGRQYRLKVVPSQQERVRIDRSRLKVYSKNRSGRCVRLLLEKWYREKAMEKFPEFLKACHESVRRYGISEPALRVKKMSKRWGSCANGRAIYLNPDLIKTSRLCIEYVILHEFCHLKIRKHTREFYRLLSRVVPDWQSRKRKLETSRV